MEEIKSQEGGQQKAKTSQTVGLVFGVIGLTALIFGLVLYTLDPDVLPLASLNAAFGGLALVIYFATNWRTVAKTVGGRSGTLIVGEAVIVVGALILTGVANFIGARSKVEWDLTRDRLFSLTHHSESVLRRMKKKVTVIGFYRPVAPERVQIREVVELYAKTNDLISLKFINPDTASSKVIDEFKMTSSSPRIVVTSEDGQHTKLRNLSEESLTNALIKVAEKPPRKAYFLTGHKEPGIAEEKSEEGYFKLAARLRDEGYTVEPLSLLDRANVPKDASLIVSAGAKSRFLSNEISALTVYFDRGGRGLFLLDPGIDLGLEPVWRRNGIQVGDNLIFEPNPAAHASGFGDDTFVIQKFEAHKITDPLESAAVLFHRARSIQPRLGLARMKTVTLLQTGPTSFGEVSFANGTPPERDENDSPGPVSVGVASEKKVIANPEKFADEARIVVFGDSDFVNNRFTIMSANLDLFLNAANWAVGDEDKISIRPKKRGASRLPLTDTQQYGIMFFSVNFMPLLIIGFGFSIWAIRRRR